MQFTMAVVTPPALSRHASSAGVSPISSARPGTAPSASSRASAPIRTTDIIVLPGSRVGRTGMKLALPVLDRAVVVPIGRADRHLAEAAGDVEHVGRLAQAGDAAAQPAHERLTVRDGGAEARGAGRPVEMVQVIGLDP